ncbi:MAG: hypothetical protein M5R36_21710 [Deltaproteobacteria bacterium]|nr:hypothetical protein [Deltaproteobacteria bacterium]
MKKLLALLIALLTASLIFAACGDDDDDNGDASGDDDEGSTDCELAAEITYDTCGFQPTDATGADVSYDDYVEGCEDGASKSVCAADCALNIDDCDELADCVHDDCGL